MDTSEKRVSATEHFETTMANDEKVYAREDHEEQNLEEDEEYSVAEQRKIIHKVDRRLLIILGLMQAVSFLDRANLSNAAVAGMTADLKLGVGNRYVSLDQNFLRARDTDFNVISRSRYSCSLASMWLFNFHHRSQSARSVHVSSSLPLCLLGE